MNMKLTKKIIALTSMLLLTGLVFAKNWTFKDSTGKPVTVDLPEDFTDIINDNYSDIQDAIIKNGVTELDDERIGALINLKYGSPANAVQELGNIGDIRSTFCEFQKYLYKRII